jgi:hypothetical protein
MCVSLSLEVHQIVNVPLDPIVPLLYSVPFDTSFAGFVEEGS